MTEYAKHMGVSPRANGRSQDVVECACGAVNRFYRWSWAGHGKARCWACKRWIWQINLEVRDDGR